METSRSESSPDPAEPDAEVLAAIGGWLLACSHEASGPFGRITYRSLPDASASAPEISDERE